MMFAAGDLETFAAYLVRLHENPQVGRQMAVEARRFTRDHAWESEFGSYLHLLARLTGHERVAAAQV